ncbi:tryptophan--tRNA ligase [bacterium]|nr:tryptophan--tRNA ligase [bacterium]
MKRLFSGIQPSGDLHIGNYLGAIRNWVRMLTEYDCIFCIVDYHAITISYEVETMQSRIINAAAECIACGLNPDECTIFVQSHVPEHTELAWIFNTVTPMGDLGRMTQFKEKSEQHKQNVNVGLFDYPVLQAADILIYKAEAVPVGQDQIQHIEFSRRVARAFNSRYGETFPEPFHLTPNIGRIMGLDGKSKMSKSLENHISLSDSPEAIKKKLATAVTDINRKRRNDPGNPEICNILTLHRLLSTEKEIEYVGTECRKAGIGCIECKMILAKNMTAELEPIRERARELKENPERVREVLEAGKRRCRTIAAETVREVKTKMGLL